MKRFKNVIRQIIRGCSYIPRYGHHPGPNILISLVILGGIAGFKGSIISAIFGAFIMLNIFGPLYLFGAFACSKETSRSISELAQTKE